MNNIRKWLSRSDGPKGAAVNSQGRPAAPGSPKRKITSAPSIRTYVVPVDNIWSGSGYRNICPAAVFSVSRGGRTYVWKVGAEVFCVVDPFQGRITAPGY